MILPILGAACSARSPGPTDAGPARQVVADPAPPGPLADAELAVIAQGRSDGRVGPVDLVVRNEGARPAILRRSVRVEVRAGTGWRPVDPPVRGLYLRADCEADPRTGQLVPPGFATSCVEIPPQSSLVAPPWLGGHGDGQCACDKCVPVEAGEYRFVLKTCDGERAIFGEPFHLRGASAGGE